MGLTALTTTKYGHLRKRTGARMDKTMEKGIQGRADEKLLGQALLWASLRDWQPEPNHQHGISYFDTADGLLKEHQAALRLCWRERPQRVAAKLRNTDTPDGMRAHEEYQCEAVSLLDGLRRLPELGAPNDLRERALAADPAGNLHGSFRRVRFCCRRAIPCAKWRLTKANCVITVNRRRCARSNLSMSQAVRISFHALAAATAADLVVEPTSKLARAMAL